ncbi:hypothetical protein IFM47457_04966 [Aspergillus lentulus]|uniref:Secreted protein n=1 Tax=Aspergillus lentulus TaxID=293939 RepID=A0ABQ1ADV0_ASPLE|nr:hypothetical protein CNMCM8060_001700 [Aspergillus lentulus]KAF4187925.1 hypothetical protein CNMCM7927_003132 [Aspergillus lentulus]KAF4197963.1 hypothetical protein CNMCM8694_001629 [Aspergillus lentulus]GFF57721.1 hypothetical protein IFM62136_03539 [Aspergillus lentulus]GFF79628.1 hypothetical protein IFM47457_04966 [Aspergillus lentulus]
MQYFLLSGLQLCFSGLLFFALSTQAGSETETQVVFGIDPGTGVKARYVEHIAREPSKIPRLELSVRVGRLNAGLQPTGHYRGGSRVEDPPAESVEDEQDNDEKAEELIKIDVFTTQSSARRSRAAASTAFTHAHGRRGHPTSRGRTASRAGRRGVEVYGSIESLERFRLHQKVFNNVLYQR